MNLLAYLRLVRVGTLFSPAADVTAGLCLCGLAWSVDAVGAVLASVCVYAAGMVFNDVADRAMDAVQRPERPLPSGSITPSAATGLGLILVALSAVLSPTPWFHVALAALAIGYDYLSRGVVGPLRAGLGAVWMGSLRALNLMSAPVVLLGTLPQAILIPAICYGLYIFAVTVLGMLEDARNPSGRAVLSVQTVPPLVGSLAILTTRSPWPAAGVGLALAALFIRRAHRVAQWTTPAIRGSMMWLLLGTMLYTALLCLGSHRVVEAVTIAGAILPARWIARRIALT